jgi:hypothetical protein
MLLSRAFTPQGREAGQKCGDSLSIALELNVAVPPKSSSQGIPGLGGTARILSYCRTLRLESGGLWRELLLSAPKYCEDGSSRISGLWHPDRTQDKVKQKSGVQVLYPRSYTALRVRSFRRTESASTLTGSSSILTRSSSTLNGKWRAIELGGEDGNPPMNAYNHAEDRLVPEDM